MKIKNVLSQIATGLIEAIIITVCSLLVVRNVCFETIVVSGSSMNPTLQSGDYGYCDKTKHTLDNINRFDIIIFEYDSNGDGKKEELIKRVIGLPNENIYFDDEENLYIDGNIINQNFSFNSDERLKNKNYNALENSYFVLGDNRPFSKDSRIIGCVQKEDIKGVLKVITAHYNDVNDLSKGKKIVPFVYF